MPFLAPLALAGLVFVPLVIAMYLLKLRRDEAVVPSTLLWQRLVADVEANAPWQRLRRSLLLLLQLLLVLLLVLLAARPFIERPAGLAGDLVLVVDTSASMQATDVTPNRLEAAKAAAVDALKDLPAGGKVSVIAAGRTARVVANGTSDVGRVRQAIAGIEPTADIGNLADALRLASALAARSGDAEILVATDAALATPPTGSVRGAGQGPAGGPRRRQPGDRRARGPDRAERPVAQRVHLGRQPRPRARRAPGPAVRRRPAARLADPEARPAAADRRLDRRHRRPAAPGVGDRGAPAGRRWREHPGAGRARGRRPGVGRRPAQGAAPGAPRRRAGPVPRDRAELPARHRAVLPQRRRLVDAHGARPVRARDLQPLPAADAAGQADPRDRAAPDVGPRHGHRDAHEPGHRHARPGRPDPPLRRPLHRPRRRGAGAGAAGLGAGGRPGPGGFAAALRRRARRPPGRGPRVRAAPLGPAAPGRVPGPAGQPRGRADGRLGHAGRRRRPRLPGHAAGARGRARRTRGAARRQRRRAGRPDAGRRERDVRADRPAGRLLGDPARGPGRLGRPVRRVVARVVGGDGVRAAGERRGKRRARRPSGRPRPGPRAGSPSTSSTSTSR